METENPKDSDLELNNLDSFRNGLEEKVVNSGHETAYNRTLSCLNTDILKIHWPKLTTAEVSHLDNCGFCQRLVKSWPRTLPFLYLGPSKTFFHVAKKEDAKLGQFLDEWLKESTSKCIYTGGFFTDISPKKLEHAYKCIKCRKLIVKICSHGSILGGNSLALCNFRELNLTKKELSEVKKEVCLKVKYGSSQWIKDLRQCRINCLNPVEIGKDQIIILPRKTELTEHHKNCPHCQLVLRYHSLQSHSTTTPECLHAKGWRTFPIFYPEDQEPVKKHIASCMGCRQLVLNAIRINFVRDKEIFNKFLKYSEFLFTMQEIKRRTQRFIGNWISSYRLRFNPDSFFSKEHPWSTWNNEDRMLKLLGPRDLLSEEEQLYLAVLKIGRDYNILDLDIVKAIEKIYFRKT
ncbi:MAG: hypothetical protein HYT63_00710 [Candidatus Yanofskybacteria bacterium]|nr:hypothetical protein [Candidatus Yanofskybacteria bacterium]